MFRGVYHGRKVLVTGHTGFKGSWLTAWLLALGADVAGYAWDVPTEPAHFNALGLGERIADFRGNVADAPALEKALDEAQPEMVFHLAAQALVRPAYDDPVCTFRTNILGTLNLLEACRKRPGIKTVVVITSDKCYKNEEWVWGYRETDTLGGNDPYSASKACAENVANAYFKSYFSQGAACATTRAGNVIGGGDWAKDRIVPDCARAWSAGKAVEIRSPAATRPWQLVLEPLSGYLWLGAMLFLQPHGVWRNQAYNFGPPANVKNTVGDVVEALGKYWQGFQFAFAPVKDANRHESGLLKLCCDKALAQLDWQAVLDFDETIRFTAEWYSRYYASPINLWDFTQGQIAAYCNLAQIRDLAWSK